MAISAHPASSGHGLSPVLLIPQGLFGEISHQYIRAALWASSMSGWGGGRIAGWILGTERASSIPPHPKMDHLFLPRQGDQNAASLSLALGGWSSKEGCVLCMDFAQYIDRPAESVSSWIRVRVENEGGGEDAFKVTLASILVWFHLCPAVG